MAGGLPAMPVVKADAYGHGMVPVARALEAAGVEALCVATLDEAVVLREAGIAAPVLVLYPIPAAAAQLAVRLGVAVASGGGPALEALLGAASAAGVVANLAIELEVETGLGRGGALPGDAVTVATRILDAGATLSGVWTHLQEAEVAAITNEQVRSYEAALDALRAAGIAVPRRHLAASAAILLGNVPRYDAVRPGLITYGLIPDELLHVGSGPSDDGAGSRAPSADAPAALAFVAGAERLRPALSLRARPVRVADLPVGHGVSYGPTWRAGRPSRIATLPIGYGDGWPRSLSNRATALVRGVRVPEVGNVAMDATMIDVTDVPGPPVGVDDEVVLIGRQGGEEIPAAEVARWRTTNSWEVTTAMSARLTRVYDAPAGLAGTRALSPLETTWPASSSGTATSATSRSTRS
jgi:alanine racemase